MNPPTKYRYETVVASYKIGVIVAEFERNGRTHVRVNVGNQGQAVCFIEDVVPVNIFLDAARKIGLRVCAVCNGTGIIRPDVENLYTCHDCEQCEGRGYFVNH